MPDEIVVTANRPYVDYTPVYGDPYWVQSAGTTGQSVYLQEIAIETAHYGAPANIKYSGTNQVMIKTVVPKFQAESSNISQRLNGIAATEFALSNGSKIPFTEIMDIFHHMDFNFTEGVAYPDNNYGGQTYYDSSVGRYVSDMDATATAAGYAAQGQVGVDYIMLHEVAHNTTAAMDFQQQEYTSYLNANGQNPAGWSNSTQFDSVEKFANDIAKAIETTLQLPTDAAPPHGY